MATTDKSAFGTMPMSKTVSLVNSLISDTINHIN